MTDTGDRDLPAPGLYLDWDELRDLVNPHLGRDRFRALIKLKIETAGFPPFRDEWGGFYRPKVKAWLDNDNEVRTDEQGFVSHAEDGPENFHATPRKKARPQDRPAQPAVLVRETGRARPDGFPDTCIPLPPDATDEELGELCQQHTARLRAHIEAEKRKLAADDAQAQPVLKTRYDGTMKAACLIYQEHPLSRFHTVKHNTRRVYLADMKVIIESVGARLIKNVTVLDIENWYRQWRRGAVFVDDHGNRTVGPERVDRAHNAVAMVRTVLRFMAALRHPECKLLAEELAKVQFERGGARDQELTFYQVRDFIRTAFDLADKGVIDRERALAMAIGTASQFELMLRQKDIIGDWAPRREDARFPAGITILHQDDETWSGFYTWENIPGWKWRTKTSKSKYRAAAVFDLSAYDLLFPLLELVPPHERQGAIVKGEHGLPIRYRTYAKTFRRIAEVAGIPFEVKNMDARAGGITEAEEAGALLEDIQAGATHEDKKTTLRYIRRRSKKIAALAEVRKQSRTAEDGGGTA